jgi:FHA domain/zinc-ribbon domain
VRCPAGHESAATDYCDVCGIAMDPDATSLHQAVDAPADAPAAPAGTICPNCQTTNVPDALFCESCGYDFTTGSLPRPVAPPPTAAPPSVDANTAPPLAEAWVAEVWIDPDWYADQQSTDPLPSPGLPDVVPLRHTSVLIGRASRSRGITPDIDLSTDSGVSRRHAQLTTDGSRWWVEDLGSSNGTYVAETVGTLPKTPVPAGQKKEIPPDGRVYVGAWTRITVRRAAPGEVV